MNDPSSRQKDKRQRITDAAVHVFAERGFHGSRVSDIAERAGVADGTIYLYFKNKEEILLSIFEEKMDAMLAGAALAVDGVDDPSEQLRAFAVFHFSQVEKNRAAAEVLQIELRLSNKFLKEYRPEKLWQYLDRIGAIVARGQAIGQMRTDIDSFVFKWAFFGALDELAMQWVLMKPARRFPIERAAREVADMFLRGLIAADAVSSPGLPEGGAASHAPLHR